MKKSQPADLEKRQRKLEEDAVRAGVERYRRLLRRQPSAASRPGIEFLRRHFETLATLIRQEQLRVCQPDVELEKYSVPLLCLDADKLAFIALQSTFNLLAADEEEDDDEPGLKHTHLAREIGRRVWEERRLEKSRRHGRLLAPLIGSRYADSVRAREVQRQIEKLDGPDWSIDNRDLHLGAALIDLAAKMPEVFVVEKRVDHRGKKPKTD